MPDSINLETSKNTIDIYTKAARSVQSRAPISRMIRNQHGEQQEPSVTSSSTLPVPRHHHTYSPIKPSSPITQRNRNVQTTTFTLSTSNNEEGATDSEDSGDFHDSSETINKDPKHSKYLKKARDDVRMSTGLKRREELQHFDKSKKKHISESSSSETIKSQAIKSRRGIVRSSSLITNSIVILVMAIICIGILMLTSDPLFTSFYKKYSNLEEKIDEKFQLLITDFPTQQSKMKLLRTAVKSIALKEPKQPSVIVLFALSGAEKTTSCFAQVLAKTIESIFDENKKFIHKLGHDLNTNKIEADVIKEDLDDSVRKGFSNGSRVFLLENFNVIPGESAMIFHGLCDDNDAPFKKVLYLFTEDLTDFGIKSSSKEIQLKTFEVTKGWSKQIHENQLSSLESRIGAYKVLIEPEENLSSLKKKWKC